MKCKVVQVVDALGGTECWRVVISEEPKQEHPLLWHITKWADGWQIGPDIKTRRAARAFANRLRTEVV